MLSATCFRAMKGWLAGCLVATAVNLPTTAPTVAIAYHIIRAWVEEEISFES